MIAHRNLNKEISCLAQTIGRCLALTTEANFFSILDPFRDFHFNPFGLAVCPLDLQLGLATEYRGAEWNCETMLDVTTSLRLRSLWM